MSAAAPTATGTTADPSGSVSHGAAPSALNQGAPNNPRENMSVTPSPPDVWAYMKMQFILLSQFAWDSSQKPGTILWSVPMSPLFMNPFIRYLTGIYNIWAGGFAFKLVMAGTGFNGGKLALVWFPPNYPPSQQNLTQATFFSYNLVDPKMNDPVPIMGRDMRIQKAHWINRDPTREEDYEHPDKADKDFLDKYARIGGWVAVVVMNPLINANNTKTVVNISILNAAAEDFFMFQFVPPKKSSIARPKPNIYFNEPLNHPFFSAFPISHLIINPQTSALTYDVFTMIDKNTGGYSRFPQTKRFNDFGYRQEGATTSYQNTQFVLTKDGNSEDWEGLWPLSLTFAPSADYIGTLTIGGKTDCVGFTKFFTAYYSKGLNYNQSMNWYGPPGTGVPDTLPTSAGFLAYQPPDLTKILYKIPDILDEGSMPINFKNELQVVSDINESIVSFGLVNGDLNCGPLICNSMLELLRTKQFASAEDSVFSVRSIKSDNPLLALRLNREGYFTAAKTKNVIKFKLEDVYLKYEYEIGHFTKLPEYPSSALDMYLMKQEFQDMLHQMRYLMGKENTVRRPASYEMALFDYQDGAESSVFEEEPPPLEEFEES